MTDSCTICVQKKQERCAILIPSKTEYSQGRADGYGFFIARMIGGETPMLISCSYCGRMHPRGYVCPKKPKHKWYRKERGQNERFRSSAAWQYKRIEVLERDHYLCRICLEDEHRINNAELQVHHITPLGTDFSQRFNTNNLITLCIQHHDEAEHGIIPADCLRELAKVSPRLPNRREGANP